MKLGLFKPGHVARIRITRLQVLPALVFPHGRHLQRETAAWFFVLKKRRHGFLHRRQIQGEAVELQGYWLRGHPGYRRA